MGDEWTRRIYIDEAEFMEDYWATVEAALALLPSVDWKPNYAKTWPRKRSAALFNHPRPIAMGFILGLWVLGIRTKTAAVLCCSVQFALKNAALELFAPRGE